MHQFEGTNNSKKSKGFTDVLYVDSVKKKYLEAASSCNIFIVKGGVISTPITQGTILAGVTRRSIIEIARDCGHQVEARLDFVEDLMGAEEVFCTGTAVVVSPVGSITYHGQSLKGSTDLLQQSRMGLVEDKKGWTIEIG